MIIFLFLVILTHALARATGRIIELIEIVKCKCHPVSYSSRFPLHTFKSERKVNRKLQSS